MEKNYHPISCKLYDYLEHFATQKAWIEVVWVEKNGKENIIQGHIQDLKTEDAQEFILFTGAIGWIRLDQLIKVGDIYFQNRASNVNPKNYIRNC